MKRIILFFSLLVFAGTTLAMEIGIIKEFENRRMALNRFKVESKVATDFDGDGDVDIFQVSGSIFHVTDPQTKQKLWEYDLSQLQPGCSGALPDPDKILFLLLTARVTIL